MKSGSSLRTAVSSPSLICGILVANMLLTAFPVPAAAQENLVENGDFSQGLEHWIVDGPTNPCQVGNPSDIGGYYGCVMVSDEETPGNPHLELWTGNGGAYGMERFEQDVYKDSLRLPKDAARITLSLRAWALGNYSYVRVALDRGLGGNLTTQLMREATSAAEFDNYELFQVPRREFTTITRDITIFNLGDPLIFRVAGDQVAVDDISIIAAPSSPEPMFTQQTNLVQNGDFSQGTQHWKYWSEYQQNTSSCCMTASEKGSPGNPHLKLQGVPDFPLGQAFQEVHLPHDATRISLSIKAWADNPTSIGGDVPWVLLGITPAGIMFNGTLDEPETYAFGKNTLGTEPASVITRDLTGFAGKNITLSITMGIATAVDDVTILATRSYFEPSPTLPGLAIVAAIFLAAFVVWFLRPRQGRRTRGYINKVRFSVLSLNGIAAWISLVS